MHVEYFKLEFRVFIHEEVFHDRNHRIPWYLRGIGFKGVGFVIGEKDFFSFSCGCLLFSATITREFLFNITIYGTVVVVFNQKIVKQLTIQGKKVIILNHRGHATGSMVMLPAKPSLLEYSSFTVAATIVLDTNKGTMVVSNVNIAVAPTNTLFFTHFPHLRNNKYITTT